MLKKGIDKREILKLLEKKLSKDYSYEQGFILGSMCTSPLEFGKEVYIKYMNKNLGDPGLFQGTADLENELINELGELFESKDNITGTFTSGGSESNIIAMRISKKLRMDIKDPEIVVPISAHASFDKGADLLGIKLRKAKLRKDFSLDLDHFKTLINSNTCGVVGIAGTTSLGLVDPIKEIGEFIENKNIFFHVDAAFGGFVLPFLQKLGYQIPEWDFSVKNVNSITADPHKMGLGIIPMGGLLLRDRSILNRIGFEIPYLAGENKKHFHIIGTRPGGTVIAFWAILKHLGINGFKSIIKDCMENTYYLRNRITEIDGIKLATEPLMNIVGLTLENGENISKLEEELRKRNWMLGKFINFNLIRIVLMPHVKQEHLSDFIDDLEEILRKLKIT